MFWTYFFLLAAAFTIFIFGLVFGVLFYRYKFFPYPQLKNLIDRIKPDKQVGPWSVGLYTGASLFELREPPAIANPILDWNDVHDIEAEFLADPFFVYEKDAYYLFFEVMERRTNLGRIGYAVSEDGLNWQYKQIIIHEPFHLSYPYVFKWQNEYYMIPESHEDLSIRLYKASSFPDKWEYMGNLMQGHHFVDVSIFRYRDKWWLFISNVLNDALNLFFSDDLLTGWQAHPMNPLMKADPHLSRPAGRIVVDGDRIFRFAQDDAPSYGIQVFAFEIIELSETTYREKIVSEEPFLSPNGKGWNGAGMHHIDAQKIGDQWMAVVDGRNE